MEVHVIFMDATAEKVFKKLEHVFSIVHKHGAHWGSRAWKKKEFTK